MSTTEYKGFNINFSSAADSTNIDAGRYYVSACGGYPHEAFNPEGYSTLNTAKGAITKHLKANTDKVADTMLAVTDFQSKGKTVPADEPKADECKIKFTNKKNAKGEPIADDPEIAKIYAEMDYLGFKLYPSDKRSRNKREGVGHVKRGGKYVRSPYSDKLSPEPRTRKQRKAAAYSQAV